MESSIKQTVTRRERINSPFYGITWEQALYDYRDGILTSRGLIYCYFHTHLRPGEEEMVDVSELCELLQINEATYYRAIGALKAKGRLNIRRGKMRVQMPQIQNLSSSSQLCKSFSQNCESFSQDCDQNSQMCENDDRCDPDREGDQADRNVPTNKVKDSKEQKQPTAINERGIGTIAQIIGEAEESGIKFNKTIKARIQTISDQAGEPAAAVRLRNAVSALKEQEEGPGVANPGGFLMKALRDGFTANKAKQWGRETVIVEDPPPPPLPAPDRRLEITIDQALRSGDRAFALTKLQTLWSLGGDQGDEIDELCSLRKRDWGFIITAQGVRDAEC